MSLPLVMPANLVKKALGLVCQFPGRMAVMFSVGGFTHPRGLPFVLDNGRFPVWSSGREWSEEGYLNLLWKARQVSYPPFWVLVPDVVADSSATFEEYVKWAPRLLKYGWDLAIAVQDGMTPDQVLKLLPRPAVIFVGGTRRWKWRSLRLWTGYFPRVHVGRVNTYRLLWRVHESGAESSDGTGWYHRVQHRQLVRYLELSSVMGRKSESKLRGFWNEGRETRGSPRSEGSPRADRP